jgi:leucyl/phenylalanyl-tRNA--protein transferase
MPYFELSKDELTFPPAYFADIDGLVAVGGNMDARRLLLAYNSGIYYWHFPLKHIKWWSPDPRTVLLLNSFEVSENRLATLENKFTCRLTTDFKKVLRRCQHIYNIQDRMNEAWFSERAFRTFIALHQKGYVQAVEVWKENELVGGIFGVGIGKLFFTEYLFSTLKFADEFALLYLIKKLKAEKYQIIDMQKPTAFFEGIEYEELSRIEYVAICKRNSEKYASEILNL